MSTVEKVEKFLQGRVKPVNVKYVADYFLMSKNAIQRALKELKNDGKAICYKKGATFYWAWKRQEPVPVAVPAKTVGLSNTPTYNRPIQNSYPAVRGYED